MAKFIGGSSDGEDIAVAKEARRIVLPVRSQKNVGFVSDGSGMRDTEPVKCDEYRRSYLQGRSQQFSVFVEQSLDDDQLMRMLLEGYRPVPYEVVFKDLLDAHASLKKTLLEVSKECIDAGVRPEYLKRVDEILAKLKAMRERYGIE